jgi:hypothetical protein
VLTDEERAEALARYQARLDALPPRTDEWTARIGALFASIWLRMARDRARIRPRDDLTSHVPAKDSSGLVTAHMSDVGSAGKGSLACQPPFPHRAATGKAGKAGDGGGNHP